MQIPNHGKVPLKRESRIFFDLRFFDDKIKKELDTHIPFRQEEFSNKLLIPSIYQILANELSFYRGKFKTLQCYPTRTFRNAYLAEDRNEIVDNLFLLLRDYIYDQFCVSSIKNGLNIKMISYNQWVVWHYENETKVPSDD